MLRNLGVCRRARHATTIGRIILIGGGVAAMVACRSAPPNKTAVHSEEPPEVCADTLASPRVPLPQRTALSPRDPARSPDYFFTTLATELPGGFGGFSMQTVPSSSRRRRGGAPERQRTVIRLQDTTLAPDALEALKARLRAHYGPMLNLTEIRLQPSRWNFAQLEEWWRYLSPRVFGAGAHMSDIDEARNRVAFEFATDSARRAARAFLDTLGVPCGLVELRVGPRAQLSHLTQ